MTQVNKKVIITIVVIITVCLIIGLGITAVTKINRLNDEINNLNDRITQIDYNYIHYLNSINNLKNDIQQQLTEQGKNYSDVKYNFLLISGAENKALVELLFSLKESPVSGEVEISYGNSNIYNEITATKLANGKFKAEMELELNKDYEISYSIVLDSIKTEKLLHINILKTLRNRFYVSTYYGSINRGGWQLNFDIGNSYYFNGNLKIASAKLEIFINNVLIRTLNIKDYFQSDVSACYEEYGGKEITINELSNNIFINSDVETRVTIVDNYGIEYVFGDYNTKI